MMPNLDFNFSNKTKPRLKIFLLSYFQFHRKQSSCRSEELFLKSRKTLMRNIRGKSRFVLATQQNKLHKPLQEFGACCGVATEFVSKTELEEKRVKHRAWIN